MKPKSKIIDWEERYKRVLADLTRSESIRAEEVQRTSLQTKLSVVAEFLPLIDDIERSLANTDCLKTDQDKAILNILSEKARQSLKLLGIEKIEQRKGDKINPLLCEVIGVVDGKETDTISEIISSGYKAGDLIVRPSRVIVSKRKLAK